MNYKLLIHYEYKAFLDSKYDIIATRADHAWSWCILMKFLCHPYVVSNITIISPYVVCISWYWYVFYVINIFINLIINNYNNNII